MGEGLQLLGGRERSGRRATALRRQGALWEKDYSSYETGSCVGEGLQLIRDRELCGRRVTARRRQGPVWEKGYNS